MVKYWIIISLLGFLLLAATGCESKLERPGVPVWFGLSAAEPVDSVALAHDLGALQQSNFHNIIIHIPVVRSAQGTPLLRPIVKQNVQRLHKHLTAQGFSIGLQLLAQHPDSLFTVANVDTAQWFSALTAMCDTLLNQTRHKPANFLIVGTDFYPFENIPARWVQLARSLRGKYDLHVGYATQLQNVQNIRFWPDMDFVGVQNMYAPDGRYKPFARQWNQQISQIALQAGKPVFITAANLIGKDKELKLKNTLRFYPDAVALQGICFNTIYGTSALTDSVSYFGLAKEASVIKWLEAYNKSR